MTRSNALRGGVAAALFAVLATIAPVQGVFADAPVAKSGAPVVLCAVKGERIADVAKAAGKADYKGKTYYFCCPGCVAAFGKADDAGKARFTHLTDLRTEKVVLTERLKAVDSELGALQTAKPAAVAATGAKAAMLHCAITGEEIASAADAAGKREFKGKTYYFCCPGCITKFDAAPAKYAAAADAAKH